MVFFGGKILAVIIDEPLELLSIQFLKRV